MENEYDSKYSSEKFYWGIEPYTLIAEFINILKPGSTILDIGSGEGRNAVFLAKNGFDVTTVDISETGIMKTKKLAEIHNVKIKTHVMEFIEFLSKCPKFDNIICLNALQFISAEKIKFAIDSIKDKTLSGGFNIISSFVTKNKVIKDSAQMRGIYLFENEELKSFYDGWELLEYKEFLGPIDTHEERPHRHYFVHLVAQKK